MGSGLPETKRKGRVLLRLTLFRVLGVTAALVALALTIGADLQIG